MIDAAWHREPLVLTIANVLLDRLEHGTQERVRPPRLKLDNRNAPSLFAANARESDYQWSLVQKMADAGWIRLILDATTEAMPGYYRNPRVELADEGALRAVTARPAERLPEWHDHFLAALATMLPPDHPALSEAARTTLPLQTYDPKLIAEKLLAVRSLADEPLLLREVASQLFFGQSKALDGKESLIAAVLSLRDCPFPESPIHLMVQLPSVPFTAVLFVENSASFEALARRRPASTEHLALIYASGYRCSARRLRTADGASVYFASATLPSLDERDRFCAWLTRNGPEIPVAFYGDLDYAGMSILARLRSSFPHAIAWQPGYDAMLASLRAGSGHPPEAARKGGQQDPISTGCLYADDVLLPALRQYGRFVDQELYGLRTTGSRAP